MSGAPFLFIQTNHDGITEIVVRKKNANTFATFQFFSYLCPQNYKINI